MRWAILLESGTLGGSTVSDGENFTTFVPMLNQYSIEPVGEKGLPMAAIPSVDQSLMLLGAGAFGPLFQGEGLAEWLLQGVTGAEFAENQVIDGVDCRVARFEKKNGMHWELAVEAGAVPLVRRFVLRPEFSEADGARMGVPRDMQLTLTLDFTDWNTEASFNDTDFVLTPPAEAQKVDSLFAARGGGQPRVHPLVGTTAPPFAAEDLAGNAVQLEQFAGKNVVILDFWATWCGPCVDALPIISRVAAKFADQNVVFYAVNQGEDPETIREFLTSEGIDVPVLLDQEGAVGQLYQVRGIPQTVVIDSQGKVQVVHVGFGGSLEELFTQELEDILAGKNLAGE